MLKLALAAVVIGVLLRFLQEDPLRGGPTTTENCWFPPISLDVEFNSSLVALEPIPGTDGYLLRSGSNPALIAVVCWGCAYDLTFIDRAYERRAWVTLPTPVLSWHIVGTSSFVVSLRSWLAAANQTLTNRVRLLASIAVQFALLPEDVGAGNILVDSDRNNIPIVLPPLESERSITSCSSVPLEFRSFPSVARLLLSTEKETNNVTIFVRALLDRMTAVTSTSMESRRIAFRGIVGDLHAYVRFAIPPLPRRERVRDFRLAVASTCALARYAEQNMSVSVRRPRMPLNWLTKCCESELRNCLKYEEPSPSSSSSSLWVGFEGDILIPRNTTHHFSPLGSLTLLEQVAGLSALWPLGRIPYTIDVASGLPANSQRITDAIAHWQRKTCIRFTPRTNEEHYINFKFNGPDDCISPVGMRIGMGIHNDLHLGTNCPLGALIHEIGHAVGLMHEQTRSDRNNYITVNNDAILPDKIGNFNLVPADYGRPIFPYNYGSIMHYGTYEFAKDKTIPSIISPQQIGQRTGLNAGDVAAVQFMYQGCEAIPSTMRCVASMDQTTTLTIKTGKPFSVMFTALYGALTPAQIAVVLDKPRPQRPSRGLIGKDQSVSWTPSATELGTRTIGATFSTVNILNGRTIECHVTVNVVSGNVCFGKVASDPTVCSGRGRCTDAAVTPCVCNPGFGGLQCGGSTTCPRSYRWGFDDENEGVSELVVAGIVTGTSAVGGGSLQVYNYANMDFLTPITPKRISFFMKGPMDDRRPSLTFVHSGVSTDDACFSIGAGHWKWTTGAPGEELDLIGEAIPDTWTHFELRIDWTSKTFDVYINSHLSATRRAFSTRSCASLTRANMQMGTAGSRVPGYLDELVVDCTDYVVPTGGLLQASPVDITRGGSTLTLTLVGVDTWTPSAAAAVVAAMRSDVTDSTVRGFNSIKSQLMTPSFVTTISGAELRFGPFPLQSTYFSVQSETITFRIPPVAVRSGYPPTNLIKIVLPGTCTGNLLWDMSTTQTTLITLSDVFEIALSPSVSGKSLWCKGRGAYPVTHAFTSRLASTVQFSIRLGDVSNAGRFEFAVQQGTTNVIKVTVGGAQGITVGTTRALPAVATNTWYKVTLALTWGAAPRMNIFVNDVPKGTAVPFSGSYIDNIRFTSWGGSNYIDDVSIGCPGRLPTYNVSPRVPVIGEQTMFRLFPGASPLSVGDSVKVVASVFFHASACTEAALAASGTQMETGTNENTVEWATVLPPSLVRGRNYYLCYKAVASQTYDRLDLPFQVVVESASTVDTVAPGRTTPAPARASCTTALHCSSHATRVSGTPPNCNCECRNQWTAASACRTCPVQFGGSDCNACASGLVGTFPTCEACTAAGYCAGHATSAAISRGSCVCRCANFWLGATCQTCPRSATGTNCDSCATGYRLSSGAVRACVSR